MADRTVEIASGTNDLIPKCQLCKRERDVFTHPMDAYDYSALQMLTGQPFGWYSGDDGEICPEDMERMVRGG